MRPAVTRAICDVALQLRSNTVKAETDVCLWRKAAAHAQQHLAPDKERDYVLGSAPIGRRAISEISRSSEAQRSFTIAGCGITSGPVCSMIATDRDIRRNATVCATRRPMAAVA